MGGIRIVIVAALALAVGAAVAVVMSAPRVVRVQRPPERLAAAAPTATVTKNVIRQRYTFSGVLSAAVPPRPLHSEGVVTATPTHQGQRAQPGGVLLEVNGRPVIGLNLPFPLWRDLEPELPGKDVAAVQAALAELGLYGDTVSGVFDAGTQAAVRSLYTLLGYPSMSRRPQPTSTEATARRKHASPPATVLPAAEVVPLGGGPWRLNLAGATVGSVLDDGDAPSLTGAGTRLTLDDGGRLAQLLADGVPRRLVLVAGDGSTQVRATVLSSEAHNGRSRVLVRAASGHLPRGTVAGSAVVRTTGRPVTSVPVTALRPTADGRTMVRALIDGRVQDVPVRIGVRGDRLVEVHGRRLVPGLTVELI